MYKNRFDFKNYPFSTRKYEIKSTIYKLNLAYICVGMGKISTCLASKQIFTISNKGKI